MGPSAQRDRDLLLPGIGHKLHAGRGAQEFGIVGAILGCVRFLLDSELLREPDRRGPDGLQGHGGIVVDLLACVAQRCQFGLIGRFFGVGAQKHQVTLGLQSRSGMASGGLGVAGKPLGQGRQRRDSGIDSLAIVVTAWGLLDDISRGNGERSAVVLEDRHGPLKVRWRPGLVGPGLGRVDVKPHRDGKAAIGRVCGRGAGEHGSDVGVRR